MWPASISLPWKRWDKISTRIILARVALAVFFYWFEKSARYFVLVIFIFPPLVYRDPFLQYVSVAHNQKDPLHFSIPINKSSGSPMPRRCRGFSSGKISFTHFTAVDISSLAKLPPIPKPSKSNFPIKFADFFRNFHPAHPAQFQKGAECGEARVNGLAGVAAPENRGPENEVVSDPSFLCPIGTLAQPCVRSKASW